MRKGQGISVNVIVIAALALIVLVILATIVIQKLGGFNKSASVCGKATAQEVCRELADGGCNAGAGEIQQNGKACLDFRGEVDNTQICCIKG